MEKNTKYYSIRFNRSEVSDLMVHQLNEILETPEPNDIEKRLIQVLDIQGIIDSSHQIHMKFLLCVICLETLLIPEGDAGYLSYKVAEKVSFLCAPSVWRVKTHLKITDDELDSLPEDYFKNNLANLRIGLELKMQELYNNRSGFAHSGISDSKLSGKRPDSGLSKKQRRKNITMEDYYILYNIVGVVIETLLELRTYGIDHIEDKGKELSYDNRSLDAYVKMLKYN